ncbi:hypothetical protein POF53_01180 [Mitsuaria sp. RG]|nr:hypothetical protein [Mitsuaria sp. RG]
MPKFVKVMDKTDLELVINVDEIRDLTPFQRDWLKGAIIHMKTGNDYTLRPIDGQNLRDFLLNL